MSETRERKQSKVNNQAQIQVLYYTDCELNIRLNLKAARQFTARSRAPVHANN